MRYTLHNKANNKALVHPAIGLWYTESLAEAQAMLEACHEYMVACGLDNLDEIKIAEITSLKPSDSLSETLCSGEIRSHAVVALPDEAPSNES